ncbi:Oxidoreductase NAD-binding domain protein, partial [Trichostrongylus colubriformis]
YLLLVAGGVGIAPFVRLLNELLENDNDETRVRLLYCVRKGSDILFKELLAQWAQHWNVKIVIFGPDVEKTSIHYLFGHVAERLNEDHFREQLRALCGDNLDRAAVGVCGRLTLEKDVVNFATRAGIEHSNIRRFLA